MRALVGLVSACLLLPAPAFPDAGAAILARLIPVELSHLSVEGGWSQDTGSFHLSQIVGEWPGGSLAADSIVIEQDPLGLAVVFDQFRLRSDRPSEMSMLVNGRMVLSGIPDPETEPDLACLLAREVVSLDLGQSSFNWGSDQSTQLHIQSMTYSSSLPGDRCWLAGELDLSGGALHFTSDSRVEIGEVEVEANLPLDIGAARSSPGDALFNLHIRSVEGPIGGEVTPVGLQGLRLAIRSSGSRAAGLVYLIRDIASSQGDETPAQRLLEAWNALHLLSPEATLSVAGFRLFLPGILPPGLHANFGRAGLTSALGQAGLAIEPSVRGIDIRGRLAITGVVELEILANAETRPVSASEIRELLRGDNLTGEALRLARINRLGLSHQDQGLDRVSQDMFGVPAGRLVEELRDILALSGDDEGVIAQLIDIAARVLRRAAGGDAVSLVMEDRHAGAFDLPADLEAVLGSVVIRVDRPEIQ